MEQRKIQKNRKCKFCKRVIDKKLIPINDTVKPKGVAFHNGKIVHSKCFRQVTGQEEYRESAVKSKPNTINLAVETGGYFR